jgi:hypothetical protein
MGKPRRYSKILAPGWAVVFVLLSVFYLSQSGKFLHLMYQRGNLTLSVLLFALLFFVGLCVRAIGQVRRAIRAGDSDESDGESAGQEVSN